MFNPRPPSCRRYRACSQEAGGRLRATRSLCSTSSSRKAGTSVVEREEKGRFSSRITTEPPTPAQPRAVGHRRRGRPDDADCSACCARRYPAARPQHASRCAPAIRSWRFCGGTGSTVWRPTAPFRRPASCSTSGGSASGRKSPWSLASDETGADTLKAVALRVGDDRYVKVSRVASGYFDAAEVDRLGLMAAPLMRTATVATPPKDKPQRGAGKDGPSWPGDDRRLRRRRCADRYRLLQP